MFVARSSRVLKEGGGNVSKTNLGVQTKWRGGRGAAPRGAVRRGPPARDLRKAVPGAEWDAREEASLYDRRRRTTWLVPSRLPCRSVVRICVLSTPRIRGRLHRAGARTGRFRARRRRG